MLKRPWILGIVSVLLLDTKAPCQDRDSVFTDSIFRAHSHTIEYREGELSGPGLQLLLNDTRRAQFVAIAENHNVREIPQLTTAMFRALQKTHGFGYLALEQGPVAIERAVAASRSGGRDSVWALGRRLPQIFHFLTDQELGMIAEVTRLSGVRTDPVWGVDREYGATPVLEELARISPDARTRAGVEILLDSARVYESFHDSAGGIRWLLERVDSASVARLRQMFGPRSGARADFLLRDLELARRSGALYRSRTGPIPTGFDANRIREEWMVEQFISRYRAAITAGDSLPKVVVKSGHWHLFRGLFRANIPTLGNFISELARANRRESYHIWLSLINRPGGWWSLGSEPLYGPLARAGDPDRWIFVDLRPLRPWAHAGRLKLSPDLRQIVFTHDAAVLIGGGSRATVHNVRHELP